MTINSTTLHVLKPTNGERGGGVLFYTFKTRRGNRKGIHGVASWWWERGKGGRFTLLEGIGGG